MMMTVDDLTELECALIDACDEWIAKGGRIAPYDEGNANILCNCPFGCLLQLGGYRYPSADISAHEIGTTEIFCLSFQGTFDGEKFSTGLGADMARRFRERYLGAA